MKYKDKSIDDAVTLAGSIPTRLLKQTECISDEDNSIAIDASMVDRESKRVLTAYISSLFERDGLGETPIDVTYQVMLITLKSKMPLYDVLAIYLISYMVAHTYGVEHITYIQPTSENLAKYRAMIKEYGDDIDNMKLKDLENDNPELVFLYIANIIGLIFEQIASQESPESQENDEAS